MKLLFVIASSLVFGDVVEPYSKPLVRYKIENGTSVEELLDLDETPLKDALIGMKEGEIRRIHLESQVFEIEVIKADATCEAHAASQAEDLLPRNWH